MRGLISGSLIPHREVTVCIQAKRSESLYTYRIVPIGIIAHLGTGAVTVASLLHRPPAAIDLWEERPPSVSSADSSSSQPLTLALLVSFAAQLGMEGEAVGLGDALQSGIRSVQRTDGANNEGLATVLTS